MSVPAQEVLMSDAFTQPASGDPRGWDAAWCKTCGREIVVGDVHQAADLIVRVPGQTSPEGLGHAAIVLEPDEDPEAAVACLGPVVEAVWVERDGGDAWALIAPDTGEILDARVAPKAEPFHVRDRGSAEWVLRRIFEAEAEASAKRHRLAVLAENANREIRRLEREAKWFRERFGDQLKEWARGELARQRGKTVSTPFGDLVFRATSARWVVSDEKAALEYVEPRWPDAVKVERSLLMKGLPKPGLANGEPTVPTGHGVDYQPPGESFTVTTRVG